VFTATGQARTELGMVSFGNPSGVRTDVIPGYGATLDLMAELVAQA
jgi:hypothetical protein